jgi:hypothetical protein
MTFSAVGAAVFYYLVHWYNSGSKTLPYTALALTGLAFMIKSNAVIYAAIVMICILHSLLSKRIKLVAFLKYEAIVSIFLLIAGGIFNVGKLIFYYLREMPLRQTHFGQTGTAMPGIKHFITLDYIDFIQNPFIKRPFVTEPAFWNMFLKSSLYGEFSYDNIILAQLLNGALLALVFITMVLAGLLIISGRNNKALLPHIVAIIISILMIMIFTSIKRHLAAQEFRFCMLMLIPLVVLYVRGLAEAKERYLVLYKLGAFIGIVFSLAGLIFYLFQPFDFGL